MGLNKSDADSVKQGRGALTPLIGGILMACYGAVASVMADPLRDFAARRLGAQLAGPEMLWVSGLVIFLVLSMVTGLIFAAAAPKRSLVKETDLIKERKLMLAEKEAKRRQAAEVKSKMRRES
jgi:hypothetical protein